MHVLIIRHAIAEDPEKFARTGRIDAQRPLTAKGRKRMALAARGLRRLTDIDLMAHSPLARSRQTADILNEQYPGTKARNFDALAPGGDPDDVLDWLAYLSDGAVVALVGHEPDLSQLIGRLTTGAARSFVRLKKGAAVMLEFEGRPAAGGARLLWAWTPGQLRILARG
ncbi:MAG: phosphohistidine phosphatase SixA [Pseudomonadota bacterium]